MGALVERAAEHFTSTPGCSASATAIGGLFVITVARRSGGKVARDLEGRRAGVEQDHLPLAQEPGRRDRDRRLRRRRLLAPNRIWTRPDRGRERTAVHAPQEPRVGQLLEVAADRVERHDQRGAQIGDDDLSVASESLEDHLAPLLGQHARYSSTTRQIHAEALTMRQKAELPFPGDAFEPAR